MPCIAAVEAAFPRHYYGQEEIAAALLGMADTHGLAFDRAHVARFFSAVGVKGRHLALPLEAYQGLKGFADRNGAWLSCALELGERAVADALAQATLTPKDIQLFATSTVTGIAVPSIEARLMHRLEFDASCRRLPLFGLGCVAGASGIARVSDYLRGRPRDAALLLCVELCSLTFQPDDASVANVIASALFGDGAAAVVLVGDDHPLAGDGRPGVLDTRSVLFPDSERVMGWDVVDTGFRVVLQSTVPELAGSDLPRAVRDFLWARGLDPADIKPWIAHPGGPAVIEAMERGLDLPAGTLERSRRCLARVGNLSSASVLAMLGETVRDEPRTGGSGMLLAMGPGFSAELVLLRW
jgi:alkylresorcinol/alkylpyrone synthase